MVARRLLPLALINLTIRGRCHVALLAAATAGHDLEPVQAMMVRGVEYMIEDREPAGNCSA